MKKLLLAVLCAFFSVSAFAGNMSDDFKNNIGAGGIGAYAKDIGALVGVTDFHDGRATSFPGFDVGVSANVLKPSNNIDDAADNSTVFIPFIFGEAKLPILGLNVALRGTAYDDFESIGGGLKYSVVGKTLMPFFPDITAGVYYDRLGTDYYDADHFSASISASVSILIFEPYIGAGWDYTDLKVKGIGPAFDGKTYKADGGRTTIGLNITPLPFMYVFGAFTKTTDSEVYQAGFGARF